jgi:hypothetical protein
VAQDAPGVREVVRDGRNGRLLADRRRAAFVEALAWIAACSAQQREALRHAARATAERFALPVTADLALRAYAGTRAQVPQGLRTQGGDVQKLDRILSLIKTEWDIVKGMAEAGGAALRSEPAKHTPD